MYFKFINGKKFYCDEKGVLTLKDGATQEVPATDTAAQDVESGVDEVAKMVSEAVSKAVNASAAATKEATEKATEAITDMLDAVVDTAKAKKADVALPVQRTASFKADEVVAGLEQVAKKSGSTVLFEVQTKDDLNYLAKSVSKTDLTGDVIVPDLDPAITRDPVREVYIEQIADTAETTSDNVSWVEVVTETGAPASTAELAAIPEKDYAFQEFKKPVQKIAVINKHSVEILNDGPALVSAIKGFLAEDLNIVTDEQLLSGNGTAPQLQGVLGVATDLNTLIGSQVLVGATHADVLRIGITKIRVAGKGKFRPTHIVLNPVDVEALELTKDSTGQYVLPPFIAADGTRIGGATVIENTGITAGTFLMGDFRKLHVRRKGGVEVEITNSDADDFAKDIVTFKIRRRLVSYVRANDDGAFLTGTFSTIKTNLAS
jgi:HK97 family phage major capsid protein